MEDWTPQQIAEIGKVLEHSSPREILAWSFDTFAPDIVLASAFGPSGVVIAHITSTLRPETRMVYLDTNLFFPQTYSLKKRLEDRLKIRFTQVEPELSLKEQESVYGPRLWEREPDQCCNLRKVVPLKRVLAGQKAWITGKRRDQSSIRARTKPVEWDYAHQMVKINPLATWTEEDVWAYIRAYDLPYNDLHDQGYPSIGCAPCTSPVLPGQDKRAGRWAGRAKTECGIHIQPAGC